MRAEAEERARIEQEEAKRREEEEERLRLEAVRLSTFHSNFQVCCHL